MDDIKSPSSVTCEARGKKRVITKEEAKMIFKEEMKEAKRMRLKGDFSKYDDMDSPFSFTKEDGSVYKNKAMIEIQKADAEYRKNNLGLTPFDAIPLPPNSFIIGAVVPVTITKTLTPILIKYSKLALKDFNNKEATNFVFANLVKSCGRQVSGYVYFITFEANDADADDAADTRNNAATRTFQAEVYVPGHPKNAKPVVKLCRMKPT